MAIHSVDYTESVTLGADGEVSVNGVNIHDPADPAKLIPLEFQNGELIDPTTAAPATTPDPVKLAAAVAILNGFGKAKNELYYLDGDKVKMQAMGPTSALLGTQSALFRSKIAGAAPLAISYAGTVNGKDVQVVRGQVKIKNTAGTLVDANTTEAKDVVTEMVKAKVFNVLNGSPKDAEEGILFFDATDNKAKALGKAALAKQLLARVNTAVAADPDVNEATLRSTLEREFADFYASDKAVMKSIERHVLSSSKRSAEGRLAAQEANVTVLGTAVPLLKKRHIPFTNENKLAQQEASNNLVSRVLQMMENKAKYADEDAIKAELRKEFASDLVTYAMDIASNTDVRNERATKFVKEHNLDQVVSEMRGQKRGPAAIREALEDKLGEHDFSQAEIADILRAANETSAWTLKNLGRKTRNLLGKVPVKKAAAVLGIATAFGVGALGFAGAKGLKYGGKLLKGTAQLGVRELQSLGRTVPNVLKNAATTVFVNPFKALKNIVATPARRLAQGAKWGAKFPGQPTIKPWKYNIFKGMGNLARRAWYRAKQAALIPTAALAMGCAGTLEGVKDAVVEDVVGLQATGVDDTFGTKTYSFDHIDSGLLGTGISLVNFGKGVVYDAPAAAFWDKPLPDLVVSGGGNIQHGYIDSGHGHDEHAAHGDAHGHEEHAAHGDAHGHDEHAAHGDAHGHDEHAAHGDAHGHDAAHGEAAHGDAHGAEHHDAAHGHDDHAAPAPHHRMSPLDVKQVGKAVAKYIKTRKHADLGDAVDAVVDAFDLDEGEKFGWLISGAGAAVAEIAKWGWPEEDIHGVEIHADHIGKQILKLTDETRTSFLKGFIPEEHLDDYNLISDEDLLKKALKTTEGHHKVEHQVVALFGKNGPYTEALLKRYTKDLIKRLKQEENIKPELAEKRAKLIRFMRKTSELLLKSDGHGTHLKHIFDHEEEKKFTIDYDNIGNYILENVKENNDRSGFEKAYAKTHGALGGKIRYLLNASAFDTAMEDEDEKKTVKAQLYRLFDMEGTIYPADIARQAKLLKTALKPSYTAPAAGTPPVATTPGTIDDLIQQIEFAEHVLTDARLKKLFGKSAPKIAINYEEFGDIVLEKVSDKETAEAFFRGFKPDIFETKFELLTNKVELERALRKKETREEIKAKIREAFNMSGSMGITNLSTRRDKMVKLLGAADLSQEPAKTKNPEFIRIIGEMITNLRTTAVAGKKAMDWLYTDKPEVKQPDYARFGEYMDHVEKDDMPSVLRGYSRAAFRKQFRPLWDNATLTEEAKREETRKPTAARLLALIGYPVGSTVTQSELHSNLKEYQAAIDTYRTAPTTGTSATTDIDVKKGADELWADLEAIITATPDAATVQAIMTEKKETPYDNLYRYMENLTDEQFKKLSVGSFAFKYGNLMTGTATAANAAEAKKEWVSFFGTQTTLSEAAVKTILAEMKANIPTTYADTTPLGKKAKQLKDTLDKVEATLKQVYIDSIK